MSDLISALLRDDLDAIRVVPKADLHNHLLLGMRRATLSLLAGRDVVPFSYKGGGIRDINDWISRYYVPLLSIPAIFPKLVEAAFQQAAADGVTIMEASIDVGFGYHYGIPPEDIVRVLQSAHRKVAPQMTFRPCLGFSRNQPARNLLRFFEPYLDLGYFRAIDLYDDELTQPIRNFREIFRFARDHGFRCTAHAGEFGTADDVREAVEILHLDAVQHGIAAAASKEVMKWLAERAVPLNVCPTSNVVLKRVKSYNAHPIRTLFDHGVKVTVNTDDVTLFDQGVSEEFYHLYQAGLFSAEELQEILQNSMRMNEQE